MKQLILPSAERGEQLLELALETTKINGGRVRIMPWIVTPKVGVPGKFDKRPLIDWKLLDAAKIEKLMAEGKGLPLIASALPEDIEEMPWHKANYMGFVVGYEAGIGAVDGDNLDSYKQLNLPHTLTQTTIRGGEHAYFTPPEDFEQRNTTEQPLPGIDIRCEGGGTVWYEDHAPDFTDLPKWCFIKKYGGEEKEYSMNLEDYSLDKQLVEGEGRNHTLAKELGVLIASRPTLNNIEVELLAHGLNHKMCKEPLSDSEIHNTVLKSATKWTKQVETTELFKIYDFKKVPKALPLEYVWGKVAARGEITGVVGLSGTGKSTFCAELLYHCASGKPGNTTDDVGLHFMGLPTYNIGNMLFVNGDMGNNDILHTQSYLDGEYIKTMPMGEQIETSLFPVLDEFLRVIEPFDVIVLDHLLSLFPVDNNSAELDMRIAMTAIKQIAKHGKGRAVIFIGHSPKPQPGAKISILGSSTAQNPLLALVGIEAIEPKGMEMEEKRKISFPKTRRCLRPRTTEYYMREKLTFTGERRITFDPV